MKAKKSLLFILIIISLFALSLNDIFAQETESIITIDVSTELGTINSYVFGMNNGLWSGISLDMSDEAAELGLTFLRWPGGEWGDRNNFTKPQLDFYMIQANLWNAEPSIHVRLLDGTPEQAAEWVRYANIEKGYNIRYWAIGNEPNLFANYTGEAYPVDQFNEEWRAFALAMRDVDPTILLMGPELNQFYDGTEEYHRYLMDEWLTKFLLANGDLVDIVSVHRYPFAPNRSGEATKIVEMRENVLRWETLVDNLRTVMQETIGRELPIAITEVNSHYGNSGGGEASPDSYYNAIWWSASLTTLIHEEVDIITYWHLASVRTNGASGIFDRYNPRPTYYTYLLYKDFGLTRLASESSDPYITVLASRRDDGTVTILVTNLYEEEVSIQLDIQGLEGETIQEAHLLSPEIRAESVDAEMYFDGTTLMLPAQSAIRLDME